MWRHVPGERALMRLLLIAAIRLYRRTLSVWLGPACRYWPSCSHYAEEAVRRHGPLRGSLMAAWRVVRCNPWSHGGYDPVRPR